MSNLTEGIFGGGRDRNRIVHAHTHDWSHPPPPKKCGSNEQSACMFAEVSESMLCWKILPCAAWYVLARAQVERDESLYMVLCRAPAWSGDRTAIGCDIPYSIFFSASPCRSNLQQQSAQYKQQLCHHFCHQLQRKKTNIQILKQSDDNYHPTAASVSFDFAAAASGSMFWDRQKPEDLKLTFSSFTAVKQCYLLELSRQALPTLTPSNSQLVPVQSLFICLRYLFVSLLKELYQRAYSALLCFSGLGRAALHHLLASRSPSFRWYCTSVSGYVEKYSMWGTNGTLCPFLYTCIWHGAQMRP